MSAYIFTAVRSSRYPQKISRTTPQESRTRAAFALYTRVYKYTSVHCRSHERTPVLTSEFPLHTGVLSWEKQYVHIEIRVYTHELMWTQLVFLLIGLLLLILSIKKRSVNVPSIPGPPTIPIFGNALQIARQKDGMLPFLVECTQKYGDVVRLWIGRHLYVFISNPKDIEIVMKDTVNIRKSTIYDYVRPWLGEGLLTSTGQHWQLHRKLITPAFHFNTLEKFVETFNEKSKDLVAQLDPHVDKQEFNICTYLVSYTLDAIMETSMGLKSSTLDNSKMKYIAAVEKLKTIMLSRAYNPILRNPLLFRLTKHSKEQQSNLKFINNYCSKVIEERRKELVCVDDEKMIDDFGSKRRLAFLDLLLLMQRESSSLTDSDIFDEVNTFLFAGHDTTYAALTFLTYVLGKHQDVQAKVYEEIVSLYGSTPEDLKLNDLQKTRYLDMVIKECLRLYTIVPLVSRLLEKDLKLTRHTIPAGTSLACVFHNLHKDPKIYPQPEVFDPERFAPENNDSKPTFSFLPFSAGLRNCIGQRFAMAEIKVTIIRLLWNFKIHADRDIGDLKVFIVLLPKNGVSVRLERR